MTHSVELKAASEEVGTLDKLAEGVRGKLKELRGASTGLGVSSAVADGVGRIRSEMLAGYEELAHRVYGRSVLGRVTDEDGKLKKTFVYRISQANVSYIDGGCYVLARNSPRASQLVSAKPGDEREVSTRGELEYLEIDEVRTFDGPIGLRHPTHEPDFRVMALTRKGLKRPAVVQNLRASVGALQPPPAGASVVPSSAAPVVAKSVAPSAPPPTPVVAEAPKPVDRDPTWLQAWDGVYLPSSETQSLSPEFFTRTTEEQERALNKPRGVTFVEGIAGAGKTSVALGRLKFFSNFETGEHLAEYGLQTSPLTDFSQAGLVGFVLSHSLKRYLRDAATDLDLARVPIKDFDEFRKGLANEYGLTKRFRSSKAAAHVLRTRMSWIRALDAAVARAAGDYLRKCLADERELDPSVRASVARLADDLGRSKPSSAGLNVHRLAMQVEEAVAAGELPAREKELARQEEAIRLRYRPKDPERQRRLARLHASFEKKPDSVVSRKLLAGLKAQDLYLAAVARPDFVNIGQLAVRADKTAADGDLAEVEDAVAGLIGLLAQKDEDGRPTLTEADIVSVIGLSGLIADGFERTARQAAGLHHLFDMRSCTGAFIDEVQDFNEVQVFLMGLCVTGTYNQVTLAGDTCQQLHEGGARKYGHLFPLVPRAQLNSPVFLDHNFRQEREPLARLSAGVRATLGGDSRVAVQPGPPAALHVFEDRASLARKIAKRIKGVDQRASVAVICSSKVEARLWFDLLEEDLATEHRTPSMSERDSLTRRFDVHFTDALEAKGLEFDVVVVPDVGAFALDQLVGRNELYVAVSRAKRSVLLGCDRVSAGRAEVQALLDKGLLHASSWA